MNAIRLGCSQNACTHSESWPATVFGPGAFVTHSMKKLLLRSESLPKRGTCRKFRKKLLQLVSVKRPYGSKSEYVVGKRHYLDTGDPKNGLIVQLTARIKI